MSIPVSVKQAVAAIWFTLAISALGTVIAARLGYTSKGEMAFELTLDALLCIIPYKISNGSNPARYFYIILCCLSVLIVLAGVPDMSKPDIISGIIQIPFIIFALYKLFQQPANEWFLAKRPPSSSSR
ncbi:MAG: hypothetical protein ACRD22_06495 [Terriglobia bacterium]